MKTKPALSRLAAFVVNTKKFYDKYNDEKREFVKVISSVEEFKDVPKKQTEIILDCLKGSKVSLESFDIYLDL